MDDKKKFDVAVLGAGPGGYVAAICAAQKGKKVALIEKEYLGGTCLNVGCIPTKTLISHAEVLHNIYRAEEFGMNVGEVSFDFAKIKQRKDAILEGIRSSLNGLILANKIEILQGTGTFISPFVLKVQGESNCTIEADKIIIATGSSPMDIGSFPCDHKKILNSTSALELSSLPKKIAIIGGGYIGCEFASLYKAFGCEVVILEALESILLFQPKSVREFIQREFEEKGIKLRCSVFVEKVTSTEERVTIHVKDNEEEQADLVIVSVGRKLNTQGFGLEKTGVLLDDKGAIVVDEKMQTSVDRIYAIGDITGKVQLAHVASHQAIVAAENACGDSKTMHYDAVPAVIFTHPEIATVGLSLEEALEKGHNARIGTFPFSALGKAQASGDTQGFAQIVIDENTGQIYGAQVVGKEASNLIAEITLAMSNELTVDCLTETIHAHPTLAEAWLEAGLIANQTPIHFPPKAKR